ncbi:MAG: alcohol dehydrogenase catalytic domain-containing protein [Proteobacteria bacterium]|jgi:scyllo-inosose 3-dehydrogenase|nr:alcohol dehydrogenase catalytic domain-containing protein [Pseudomonadota bacterium]
MKAVQIEADWNPRIRGRRATEADSKHRFPVLKSRPTEPEGPGVDSESPSSPMAGQRAEQACNFWQNPRFCQAQLPDPQPLAEEVVIEVALCGICGSDTHCYQTDVDGYVLFSGPARFPVVPGHEYSGRVVAIGAAVRDIRLGQLVTAEGMLYCGTCAACRRGRFNQCFHLELTGLTAPGAFARYIAVHEKHVWGLDGLANSYGDEKRALVNGALVEPLGCAFNGIWGEGRGLLPGSHVAVFGCGPIGLGAILLCRAAGAATITAFDVIDERVALAKACGADFAHTMDELQYLGSTPSKLVLEQTGGWGADLVVEAAGAIGQTMPEIEACFAPAGGLVYLGRTGERALVGLDVLVSSASWIVGARGHAGGSFDHLIRMMERGVLDPGAIVTAQLPLDDVLVGMKQSTTRKDGKILLISQ